MGGCVQVEQCSVLAETGIEIRAHDMTAPLVVFAGLLTLHTLVLITAFRFPALHLFDTLPIIFLIIIIPILDLDRPRYERLAKEAALRDRDLELEPQEASA